MVKRDDYINFTKRTLEALPTPQYKRATWHDKQTRGLGLLVQPTGHKSFFWFRKVRGMPTWKTIGAFPDLTIEQARSSADQFNTDIAEWKRKEYTGPSPFKRRDGLTVDTLFEKYFEVYEISGCSPSRGPATPKAIKDARAWYARYLKRWGNRKVDSIQRDDVRDLHAEVSKKLAPAPQTIEDESEKPKRKRTRLKHGPIIANRVVGLLRRVINWAIRQEMWAGDNPAEKIVLNPEKSRERYVEPREMGPLLDALEKERFVNWDLHDAVLLDLYLGPRKGNLLAMRWCDIKMSVTGEVEWEIPKTKNGNPQIVPIPFEALSLLQERLLRLMKDIPTKDEQDAWKRTHPWVFPSNGKSGHLKDIKRSWTRLRKDVGISDVHFHDLRRTHGSYMAGSNVSLPIIGKALGHKSLAATQVYSRLNLDPVRHAQRVAIEAMGRAQNQKVLEASNG